MTAGAGAGVNLEPAARSARTNELRPAGPGVSFAGLEAMRITALGRRGLAVAAVSACRPSTPEISDHVEVIVDWIVLLAAFCY